MTTHYENGQLKYKGMASEGKRDGPWEVYDVNGQLMKIQTMKDGEFIDLDYFGT